MKKITKILLGVLVAVIGLVLTGCKEEQLEVKQFSMSFHGFGPGYVSVMATVPSPTTVAYLISEYPMDDMTDMELNITGFKTIFYKDGEQQLLDYELKEDTYYYVYLVGLLGEQFSQLYTFEFETGKFTFNQLATIVAVLPDGYKVHLNMPDRVRNTIDSTAGSTAIRWAQSSIMTHNYNKMTYGEDEYDFLLYNGGNSVRKDTTLIYNDANILGPSYIDQDGNGRVDENDVDYQWDPISPGEPVIFMAAEFEFMEPDQENVNGFGYPSGWKRGYYLPTLNPDRYFAAAKSAAATKGAGVITDLDVSSDVDAMWTGAYQKKIFRTRVPDVLPGTFDIKIEELRSVDATILITPSDNIYRYLYTVLDEANYQYLLKLLSGREEYLQWAVASYFSMLTFNSTEAVAGGGSTSAGPTRVILSRDFYNSVPSDTKFHILITGMQYEDIGSAQCFHHSTFYTPKKTKNYGPDITVTALPDLATPYSAAFNVKCNATADNPLVSCYYGANYYKDWVLEVNSGATYEDLGQTMAFTEDEIEEICSPEGYTMYIPSIDGAKTRLVVVGWNDENISNGVNLYEDVLAHPAVDDCVTPYAKAETDPMGSNPLIHPMASNDMKPLLTDVWTLTATVLNNKVPEVQKSKVHIKHALVEGVDYPSELPDSVMKIYQEVTNWETSQIEGHFERFKTIAEEEYNAERLRGQRKLLLEGWLNNDSQGRLDYYSPWDMFVSRNVSTVDVESLFTEFGPKMYIKVNRDKNGRDSLTISANKYYASPVANWSVPFYMAGYANKETNNTLFYYGTETRFDAPLEFPVTLSEDLNTITIHGFEAEGTMYYPNVIGEDNNTSASSPYILEKPIISDVVLTRGWVEETLPEVQPDDEVGSEIPETRSVYGKAAPVSPVASKKLIHYGKRTVFKKHVPVRETKFQLSTLEQTIERIDKHVRRNRK